MKARRRITLLGFIAVAAGGLTTTALPVTAGDSIAKRAAKDEIKAAHIQTSHGSRTLPTMAEAHSISVK